VSQLYNGPNAGAALEVEGMQRRPPEPTNPQMQGLVWEQGFTDLKACEGNPGPGVVTIDL